MPLIQLHVAAEKACSKKSKEERESIKLEAHYWAVYLLSQVKIPQKPADVTISEAQWEAEVWYTLAFGIRMLFLPPPHQGAHLELLSLLRNDPVYSQCEIPAFFRLEIGAMVPAEKLLQSKVRGATLGYTEEMNHFFDRHKDRLFSNLDWFNYFIWGSASWQQGVTLLSREVQSAARTPKYPVVIAAELVFNHTDWRSLLLEAFNEKRGFRSGALHVLNPYEELVRGLLLHPTIIHPIMLHNDFGYQKVVGMRKKQDPKFELRDNLYLQNDIMERLAELFRRDIFAWGEAQLERAPQQEGAVVELRTEHQKKIAEFDFLLAQCASFFRSMSLKALFERFDSSLGFSVQARCDDFERHLGVFEEGSHRWSIKKRVRDVSARMEKEFFKKPSDKEIKQMKEKDWDAKAWVKAANLLTGMSWQQKYRLAYGESKKYPSTIFLKACDLEENPYSLYCKEILLGSKDSTQNPDLEPVSEDFIDDLCKQLLVIFEENVLRRMPRFYQQNGFGIVEPIFHNAQVILNILDEYDGDMGKFKALLAEADTLIGRGPFLARGEFDRYRQGEFSDRYATYNVPMDRIRDALVAKIDRVNEIARIRQENLAALVGPREAAAEDLSRFADQDRVRMAEEPSEEWIDKVDFPESLKCRYTLGLLYDPCIDQAGNSFEFAYARLFPTSMASGVALGDGELRENITLKKVIHALPVGLDRDLLKCPLTKQLMVDPVVHTDGVSYERVAIEGKLQAEGETAILYPNRALQEFIKELQLAVVQRPLEEGLNFEPTPFEGNDPFAEATSGQSDDSDDPFSAAEVSSEYGSKVAGSSASMFPIKRRGSGSSQEEDDLGLAYCAPAV